jgi:hypothetical protein
MLRAVRIEAASNPALLAFTASFALAQASGEPSAPDSMVTLAYRACYRLPYEP